MQSHAVVRRSRESSVSRDSVSPSGNSLQNYGAALGAGF